MSTESTGASTWERVGLRLASAFAVTVGLIIAVVVIALGGTVVHGWLDPGASVGQGEGIAAMLCMLLAPIVGIVTAIHLRIGLVIAALYLCAVLALFTAAALGF